MGASPSWKVVENADMLVILKLLQLLAPLSCSFCDYINQGAVTEHLTVQTATNTVVLLMDANL